VAKTNTAKKIKTSIGEAAVKKPNPIDIHVGSRMRLRRMLIGMSQEKLGEEMGITFQQIQKYEKGTNRISASRLFQLAQILGVDVQYFYDDANFDEGAKHQAGFSEPAAQDYIVEFLGSRDGLELNRAFARIADPKIRRRIIELVRSLSEDGSHKITQF
jgi:transcriptional regulator with XRE-family HTH domain